MLGDSETYLGIGLDPKLSPWQQKMTKNPLIKYIIGAVNRGII